MKKYRLLERIFHNRSLLCVLAWVNALIITLVVLLLGITQNYAVTMSDVLYKLTPMPNNIVVIAIDDKSLQEIGRWPWDRKIFAQLIEKLQESAIIGIDISFFEKSNDDDILAKSINNSRVPIVLASEFQSRENDFLVPVFSSTAKTGHINLQPDSDGVIRSLPTEIYGVSSFSREIAQEIEPLIVPRQLLLSFRTEPTIISIADVLANQVLVSAGKIVLIGVTAPDFHDDHLTPINKRIKTPGIVIHANAIAAMQQQQYLERQSFSSKLLSVIILSFLTALCFWMIPLSIASIVMGIFMGAYVFYALNVSSYLIIDLFHPLGGTILTAVSCIAALYAAEQAHKRWVANVFGKYVSKEVAHQIMKAMHTGEDINLGGEKREITIMFSDIRGFTTLSEALSPEELVSVLNEYFSAMTRIIMDKRGVVDKFIGDAIMAFWNAPIDQEEHAIAACRAALGMVKQLDELQRQWKARNQPEIHIGIGLNTGNAVVGNMGSVDRLSYTAMGDSVNLASRLEGLTKEYGVSIIISEFTHEKIKEILRCRKLDRVRVKGKRQPIAIYEVLGEKSDHRFHAFIEAYEGALELYFHGEFKKAQKAFDTLLKFKDNKAAHVIRERCIEYIKHPPQEWDGVYAMKTK